MNSIIHTDEKIVNKDKAGEDYWSTVWKNTPLPPPFRIHSNNINDYPNKVMHKIFLEIFEGINTKGKTLMEVGCGNSVFLSYFATEFGFEVSGIDYSDFGCEQTKRIFKRDNIQGEILLVDAFNPPVELINKYDVVCSFGVVEHFINTADTLKAFSKFLKPGGILITSVPNFVGATGLLHKWFNKPVYDIHVPMSSEFLGEAIKKAGLEVLVNKYFLSISFAITLEGIDGKKIPYYGLKKFFVKTIRYFSKVIWLLESVFGQLPAGRFLSAGILTSARKPLNSIESNHE